MLRIRVAAALVLTLHFIVLIWVAWALPIGPSEAKIFYEQSGIVHHLMSVGIALLPSLDFINVRLPFLAIHLLNVFLFYRLSQILLKDSFWVLVSLLIFLFLPGIISSAVLASSTGLILAFYQMFLLLWLRNREKTAMATLPLFLLMDKSSVVLMFALFLYSIYKKDRLFSIWTLILFFMALYIYGFDVSGKPKNYFVDTVGLYAAIFSPLLFLYFFYSLYRSLIRGERGIIWFISFTVLILSLLFSIRQRVSIEDFAPFVVVAVLLMVKVFMQAYCVRLPVYRKKYKLLASIALVTLFSNALVLLFHKPLFLMLDDPKKHFAYKFYYPYWCSQSLKKIGIKKVKVDSKELAYQLRYYGIKSSDKYALSTIEVPNSKKVSILYKNRVIKSCYVSKINSGNTIAKNKI